MTDALLSDARRFVELLARPGDVFELRALAKGRGQPLVTAGFFDDMAALADAACARSGRDDGVYVTINPVMPALLARAPKNRVRQAGGGDTTSDRDVQTRRHLLVDVDPVRPAGISSSDVEHAAALELTVAIAEQLAALGWPDPIRADSGNGGHLVYGIDLPVDDAGLVKRVLLRLSALHSNAVVKVDEKVFNPARISKFYGTLTRKGESTDDRPHRLARILSAPATLGTVTRAQLEAFAPEQRPAATQRDAKPANRGPSTFDLATWIGQHLPDAKERSWSEGRKWILPVCPFNGSHASGEAFITEKTSGSIAAGCQHESCFKSWRDLRLLFEPDAYDRAPAASSAPDRRVSDRTPPPEVIYQDASYREELEREIDAIADRDRDPTPAAAPPPKPAVEFRLYTAGDALAELVPLAEAPIFPTPFPTLNEAIGFGGLLGTQVYTVAAGTGRGKTTWVAALAVHAARTVPVIVVSYEMIPAYFVARQAAGKLGVHSNAILRMEVPMGDVLGALDASTIHRLRLMKRPTLEQLGAAVDAVKAQFGTPPLVIIDYIQKLADEIASRQSRPDLRMATSEASAALLAIGERTGAAIVAVSAVGRGKKSLETPRKFDPYQLVEVAKESGAVEYDGAGLIILSLSDDYEGEERVATMTLAKARFGREVHIDARYNGSRGTWRDVGEVWREKAGPDAPAAPSSQREPTFEELRAIIADDLRRNGPAANRTAFLKRVRGKRPAVLRPAYLAMVTAGEIQEQGFVRLTQVGEQIALPEVP